MHLEIGWEANHQCFHWLKVSTGGGWFGEDFGASFPREMESGLVSFLISIIWHIYSLLNLQYHMEIGVPLLKAEIDRWVRRIAGEIWKKEEKERREKRITKEEIKRKKEGKKIRNRTMKKMSLIRYVGPFHLCCTEKQIEMQFSVWPSGLSSHACLSRSEKHFLS